MTKKAKASTVDSDSSTAAGSIDTTEQEYRELKPRPKKQEWVKSGMKDTWITGAVPEGEIGTPRIKQLDAKTFAVYRNGKYLGSEETFELAEMRFAINRVAHKNRVMKAWEKNHPDEIPPFLDLTKEERAEYWRHHPPMAALSRLAQPGALPKPVGGGGVPATPGQRARAELVAESGPAKAAPKAKAATASGRGLAGVVRAVEGAKPLGKVGTKWWARQEAVLKGTGRTVAELNDKDAIKHMLAKGQITVEEK